MFGILDVKRANSRSPRIPSSSPPATEPLDVSWGPPRRSDLLGSVGREIALRVQDHPFSDVL